MRRALDIILLLASVLALAVFFAQVEIQIEGAAGWGADLPTWRIEDIGCSTCSSAGGR